MKYIIIVCITFFSLQLYAQGQIEVKQKVVDFYGNERVNELKVKNPGHLEFMNYTVDHGYVIREVPPEKLQNLPELYKIDKNTKEAIEETLTDFDENNFNPLEYKFERKYDGRTTYRIGNTGKIIVFYSIKEISEEIKANKENANN